MKNPQTTHSAESNLPSLTVFQASMVPAFNQLTEPQREESRRILQQFLASRSPSMGRQLKVLIHLIFLYAWVRYGTSFLQMERGRQMRVLRSLATCPVALIRKGMWGLSTLCKMSVYGQESTYPLIRYHMRDYGNMSKPHQG
jgi:hypothetical protein